MDHIGILKHAFRTTLRYRALWVLGFLWAIVGGNNLNAAATGNPGGGGSGYRMGPGDFSGLNFNPRAFLGFIVLACCLLVFVAIAATIVRYVLQSGIYRSLAHLEHDNVTPGVRRGFREGWHRRTWRLFAQDLVVGIVLFLVLILALAVAASPLLLLLTQSDAARVIGIAAAVGLGFLWLLLLIATIIVVSVVKEFWWREAVLGDKDTFTAISNGWSMVRQNLGDVAIMWLLMFGLGIALAIVMIPVVLILLALVGVIAVAPGYLIYQATQSIAGGLIGAFPWDSWSSSCPWPSSAASTSSSRPRCGTRCTINWSLAQTWKAYPHPLDHPLHYDTRITKKRPPAGGRFLFPPHTSPHASSGRGSPRWSPGTFRSPARLRRPDCHPQHA